MLVTTLAVRWILALVLVAAGTAKLGQSIELVQAISRYGVLPDSLVPIAAKVLPVAELLLGILLATGIVLMPAAIACAGLFAVFAVAIAISLMQGQSFDCGCGLGTSAQISWRHVARAASLAGFGVLVAVEPPVLAVTAHHVGGAPAVNQLIAVPLAVFLLCVSYRLVGPARETVSIFSRSMRRGTSAWGA